MGKGYFVASSGNVTDEIIQEYIKNQDIEERRVITSRLDNFRAFQQLAKTHRLQPVVVQVAGEYVRKIEEEVENSDIEIPESALEELEASQQRLCAKVKTRYGEVVIQAYIQLAITVISGYFQIGNNFAKI